MHWLRGIKKGFTLVELLIVMIVIGILVGMLLLAVGSSTDKAEATKVVNALRNYKSAAIMYYGEEASWPTVGNNWERSLDKYMDRSLDTVAYAQVEVVAWGHGRSAIGLIAAPGSPLNSHGVQKKLADQATISGLCGRTAGSQYHDSVQPSEVFIKLQ